jgi:hypothetical protein
MLTEARKLNTRKYPHSSLLAAYLSLCQPQIKEKMEIDKKEMEAGGKYIIRRL